MSLQPLFNDEFQGAPNKRALAHVLAKREKGSPVVGAYCTYAPLELIHAMNGVPALLCAFANATVAKAEETLPANLCPLIKSSFGFIENASCPFFESSNAVIGETTCDGKKKMFELIAEKKPFFMMELPQMPETHEAKDHWVRSTENLKRFLETTFHTTITNDALEKAIHETNVKNRLMRKIASYMGRTPSVLAWNEFYDIVFLAGVASGQDINPTLERIVNDLENRIKNEQFVAPAKAPRVLVTGSPIGGDATKIYKAIMEEGGTVVAMDNCMGLKLFADDIQENTGNPIQAIAERYLKIPCSCMTPNTSRLTSLDQLIQTTKPNAVMDIVLQACHGYNVESVKVERHVRHTHKLPFLKIVTDYSQEDMGQIKTRVGALLEMTRS